jgi:hypothetical protein
MVVGTILNIYGQRPDIIINAKIRRQMEQLSRQIILRNSDQQILYTQRIKVPHSMKILNFNRSL